MLKPLKRARPTPRIFVSTALVNRVAAAAAARDLERAGCVVTSRWICRPPVPDIQADIAIAQADSRDNLADIDAADLFVLLTVPGKGTGHHFEAGYAMAHETPMVLVGPVTSIFQHLADQHFEDWPTAMEWIIKWMET